MSHRCEECEVNWWPYQTRGGQCPQCAGGLRRVKEAPDENAQELHHEALMQRRRNELFARFDAYCERREQSARAAFIAEFSARLQMPSAAVPQQH